MSQDARDIFKKNQLPIIVLLIAILLITLVFFSLSAPLHRWGDSSNYYMQISSLAIDHDLEYQPMDIQRALTNKFDDLPAGLFLIKTDQGKYFYGKEFSYALFAVPFFLIFNTHGILLFNSILFGLMILIGFVYLQKKGNSHLVAFFVSLIFFTLSTAIVYIFWLTPEIYTMFIIMAGLFLWFLYSENQENEQYLFIAAFIFGLATVAKLPNGLLFLPLVLYELYYRRCKHVVFMLVLFLLPLLLFYGFFYLETGINTFYGGNRLYYINNFPFTNGFDALHDSGLPGYRLEWSGVTSLIGTDTLQKSIFNGFYYLFGKYSGMIWYFPLAIVGVISFLISLLVEKKRTEKNERNISGIKENTVKILIFLGIMLNILFYIIVDANNYLGGQAAIGNRYFYIFPAFLFLIGKVDRRIIIPFLFIAIITIAPVINDPVTNSQFPENHTYYFPYTFFPIEYSQINNLPIWQHQLHTTNYTIYGIEGKFGLNGNTIVTNGSSKWLLKIPNYYGYSNSVYLIFTGDNGTATVKSKYFSDKILFTDGRPGVINLTFSQPIYTDNNYRLYEIDIDTTSEVSISPLIDEIGKNGGAIYLNGWFDEDCCWNNVSTRWMSGNSRILTYSDSERDVLLQFNASSFDSNRTLHLISPDKTGNDYSVSPVIFSPINSSIHLNKGYNIIQLSVPDGCAIPSDIPELHSQDGRCLSIAIQNISITSQPGY